MIGCSTAGDNETVSSEEDKMTEDPVGYNSRRELPSMITVGDVRDFGASWFDAVARGATAAEQAQFFLDPHAPDLLGLERRDHRPEGIMRSCMPSGSTSGIASAIRSHAAQCSAGAGAGERHRLLAGGVFRDAWHPM